MNINSSQQKLSDDSSFLEDSSLSQKNKKKIGIGDAKEYNRNLKKNIIKEKKFRILEVKKLIYDSFDDDEIIEEELLNGNIMPYERNNILKKFLLLTHPIKNFLYKCLIYKLFIISKISFEYLIKYYC